MIFPLHNTMSTIIEPEFPAGSPPRAPSDGPHIAALEKAHELFRAELASNEGYEDQGESDGVQLWRKPDPEDPYAASTVKGEAIVQNATPDQVSFERGGEVGLASGRKKMPNATWTLAGKEADHYCSIHM